MERITRRALIAGTAAATLAMAAASWGAPEAGASGLAAFEGVWEVVPRGPGRGGPPGRGEGARAPGPPPEGDAGDDLPGPDIEGLDRGDRMTYAIMTPAGRAAFERMNPRDLPANNCLSNGLPSLVGIPDVQQWTLAGDVLTIRYANFNTVRTVYLDGRAASGPPSLYGHSTGRFAGGELVITTTGLIATPGGLGRNAPGSASRSYVERYRLAAGGSRVTGSLTVHDPEYLTRDLERPIAFQRPAEGTIVPNDIPCDVEASQRYLD